MMTVTVRMSIYLNGANREENSRSNFSDRRSPFGCVPLLPFTVEFWREADVLAVWRLVAFARLRGFAACTLAGVAALIPSCAIGPRHRSSREPKALISRR